MRPLAPASAAVLLMIGTAGCASEPPPRPATGATTVILQAARLPGMLGFDEQADPPEFTLYGDGRVVVDQGRKGLIPRLTEYRVGPGRIRALFAEAAEAELFEGRRHDVDGIMDAGVLRIVIRSERGVHRTEVVAPAEDDGGDRGAAVGFAGGLRPAGWRDDLTRPPSPYRAERLGVYVSPESDPPEPDLPATVEAWPGSSLTAERLRTGECLTLRGEEAATVAMAVASLPGDTVWRQDGTTFRAWFRPLLPHETDCRTVARS